MILEVFGTLFVLMGICIYLQKREDKKLLTQYTAEGLSAKEAKEKLIELRRKQHQAYVAWDNAEHEKAMKAMGFGGGFD